MGHLLENCEIKFEMSGADETRLLAGQRQDLMQDGVEQVRAGVRLHGLQSMVGIDPDLDPTSSRRESASLDVTHVRDVVRVVDFLTIWKIIN